MKGIEVAPPIPGLRRLRVEDLLTTEVAAETLRKCTLSQLLQLMIDTGLSTEGVDTPSVAFTRLAQHAYEIHEDK